jgi:integrase
LVKVQVWQQVRYDDGLVAAALGDEPLPVRSDDEPLAPFITIDGRIHGITSNYLRHRTLARPNRATARRDASDLAGWLDHLISRRNRPPFEDSPDPVLQATEDDFAAYYRLRQYGGAEDVLTPDGWRHAASTIKQLYEYLLHQYQHTPPFRIITVGRPGGWKGTTISGYRPRRRNTGSAGTPLTPEFAHLLLMGALRVDLVGHQERYAGADRDHALLSLAMGSGLRRNNLAHITHYELPRPSDLPLTTMRVADQITKGDAGGDTLVFSHYLPAIQHYVTGARAELAARRPYRPHRPLHIIDADDRTVRYRDPSVSDPPVQRLWIRCDEDIRRRLVEPDGSSPILFLNEHTGGPLAYSTLQHTAADAARFARERLNPDFPHFRLHDCRHSYAVHLAIAIHRGVIAQSVPPERRDDWVVDHIAEAVELVKFSLGHASEDSTRLYIQTTHRFLHLPTEHFLGDI